MDLYRARHHSVKEICNLMGISRATLYAYVEEFADRHAAGATSVEGTT